MSDTGHHVVDIPFDSCVKRVVSTNNAFFVCFIREPFHKIYENNFQALLQW